MKKILSIALFTMLSAALLLTGCPNDPPADEVKVTVTFDLNGVPGTAPASQTFVKGGKANRPSSNPSADDYTFANWYTTKVATPVPATTAAYNFSAAVNANLTLYAGWVEGDALDLSDIIKIGSGTGVYQGTTDWFLELADAPSNKPAIKISPDTLATGGDANSYRLGFDFASRVDIRQYGYIEFDVETDGANPSNAVLSVFIYKEDAEGNPSPEKKMDFGASGAGTLRYTFNGELFYSTYSLTGFEYYTASINATTNLYITRVELGGTAVPEPELGEEVEATNVYLTHTAGATSGTQSLIVGNSANDLPSKAGYQKVYVYFDPLGENFAVMEIILNRPSNGGNFSLLTAIDGIGESNSNGAYLGWMGYGNPPKWRGDPGTAWSGVNKATLKCITFEVERGTSVIDNSDDVLSLVSVIFYKSNAVLQSIAVTDNPSTTTYAVGDTFNKAGLKVTASYTAGGGTADVTNSAVLTMGSTPLDGYQFVAGDVGTKTVTVTYTEGEIIKTASFGITVSAAQLVVDSLAVTPPNKVSYIEGNTFNKSGLVVIATYTAGGTADVTSGAVLTMGGTNLDGYQFAAGDVGAKTVTVTYGGKTETFGITVAAYVPPSGNWYLTDAENGSPAVGNAVTGSGSGDDAWYVYIYFDERPAGIETIKLDFTTSGGITLTKQCVYDATGTWGWGWGNVTSGANFDLSGAGSWGASGAALDTTTLKGICIKVAGDGTFTLDNVTITAVGGGGGGLDITDVVKVSGGGTISIKTNSNVSLAENNGATVIKVLPEAASTFRFEIIFSNPVDITSFDALFVQLEADGDVGSFNVNTTYRFDGEADGTSWGNGAGSWGLWDSLPKKGLCTGFEFWTGNLNVGELYIKSITFENN
jgi:uncharacterized repeat protein (TIGR02543 family)